MIDIKINGYQITTDEVQFVLKKEKTVADMNSKNYGEIYYDTVGYFGSLEGLMASLIKKMIVTTKNDIKTLGELTATVKQYRDMIKESLGYEMEEKNNGN